jgi:hypothetical protein
LARTPPYSLEHVCTRNNPKHQHTRHHHGNDEQQIFDIANQQPRKEVEIKQHFFSKAAGFTIAF